MALTKGWSFKKNVWNANASGLSDPGWRYVNFLYDNRNLIPRVRGVYLVVLSLDDMDHTPFKQFASPLYVGHTLDLQQRFSVHSIPGQSDNIKAKLIDFRNVRFWYRKFADLSKEELKEKEQSLIEIFGPTINKINSVYPGVKDADVLSANVSNQEGK